MVWDLVSTRCSLDPVSLVKRKKRLINKEGDDKEEEKEKEEEVNI